MVIIIRYFAYLPHKYSDKDLRKHVAKTVRSMLPAFGCLLRGLRCCLPGLQPALSSLHLWQPFAPTLPLPYYLPHTLTLSPQSCGVGVTAAYNGCHGNKLWLFGQDSMVVSRFGQLIEPVTMRTGGWTGEGQGSKCIIFICRQGVMERCQERQGGEAVYM